jgi:cytochrome c oxidase subunit 3
VVDEKAHGDGHGDNKHLAHHFFSMDQQRECETLGMWLFLAQEIMFFGGLLASYAVYRTYYPEAWEASSRHLDITWGFVNTLVLLASSFTMAMGVRAAMSNNRKSLLTCMTGTLVLGFAFLGIKAIEYKDKWDSGLIPGIKWDWAEQPAYWMAEMGAHQDNVQLFFVLYFVMTGMHALHMIIGIALLAWLMYLVGRRNKYYDGNYMPIELFGFYWHFVDIVWVFLFPLLYLINRVPIPGH